MSDVNLTNAEREALSKALRAAWTEDYSAASIVDALAEATARVVADRERTTRANATHTFIKDVDKAVKTLQSATMGTPEEPAVTQFLQTYYNLVYNNYSKVPMNGENND